MMGVLVTTSFQFPSSLAGGAALCVGAVRRLVVLGSVCVAVVLAGAAWAPASASAATPRIDLKVLLVGTSTTEPGVVAWRSALQREGVAFDTLIESSATASGTGCRWRYRGRSRRWAAIPSR